MVSNSTVTAIKGNTVTGSLFVFEGEYDGTVDLDTDFATVFKELGLASSSDGVGVARAADSNTVVAWGDNEVDETYSNHTATITINLFSFKSLQTLKTLFGSANVTKTGTTIKVSAKAVNSAEKNSLAIVGVDKNGLAAVLFAKSAAVNPNQEFTWNDTDVVTIPAEFKLYKDKATQEFFQLLLEDAPAPASRTASK